MSTPSLISFLSFVTQELGQLFVTRYPVFRIPESNVTLTFHPTLPLRFENFQLPPGTATVTNGKVLTLEKLSLTITAPQTLVQVGHLVTTEDVTLYVTDISCQLESDCDTYVKIRNLSLSDARIISPGPGSLRLRQVDRLLWELRQGAKHLTDTRFILPVRVCFVQRIS